MTADERKFALEFIETLLRKHGVEVDEAVRDDIADTLRRVERLPTQWRNLSGLAGCLDTDAAREAVLRTRAHGTRLFRPGAEYGELSLPETERLRVQEGMGPCRPAYADMTQLHGPT